MTAPTIPMQVAPAAGCSYGCGYEGSGTALSTHERQDHHPCLCCGQSPVGTLPVAHLSDCMRAAGGQS